MDIIKCVVVGDTAVGKTSLYFSYINELNSCTPTVFNTYSSLSRYEKNTVILTYYDNGGSAEYDCYRPVCYGLTDIALLCFAVDDEESFQNLKLKWIPEIRKYCPKASIFVVGTKTDLRGTKPCMDREEGQYLCLENWFDYFECSIYDYDSIRELFDAVISETAGKRNIKPL